jgi:Ca-activated chloride channel family protein
MTRGPERITTATAVAILVAVALSSQPRASGQESQEGFRFRTGVELINVTATVTDSTGRFISGLTRDDFILYEDGVPREITHFSADRVPVSLGLALDTSGSMAGEKYGAALDALDRFLYDLLDPQDEVFVYRFGNYPILVHDWTTNRDAVSRALRRVSPAGGTAMYDTIAEAVPMAQGGQQRKKALVVISDGNDTSSGTSVYELKQLIRETEVLVYAIGIDGRGEPTWTRRQPGRLPIPLPFPVPGRRQPMPPWPGPPSGPGGGTTGRSDDRVNVGALRELTDDSGGRTEIIRGTGDLGPATSGIADELSRQYFLGYPAASEKDGRWHSIRVEVRERGAVVRARRGYVASP